MINLSNFKKPPISEVICGLKFNPLDLKAHHFGKLWEEFKDFPKVEHAPILTDTPVALPIEEIFSALPRVWFVNEDENELIQFQNNMFFYNWRKREGKKEYPRYSSIIEKFWKNFDILENNISKNDIGKIDISSCELTYTNFIDIDKDIAHNASELFKFFNRTPLKLGIYILTTT